MQIIIQQFLEKVTSTMQKNLKDLNNLNNLSDFTDNLQADLMSFGREFTQKYIEIIEEEIKNSSERKKEYTSTQSFPREIVTIFGRIDFSRRYYEKKQTKAKVFLLDRALGLANKERLLKNVEENLLELATKNAYEYAGTKAAYDTVISKETVKNKISELNFDNIDSEVFETKKNISRLYIQADEDHVALQAGGIAMPRLVTLYEENYKGKLLNKTKLGGMYNNSIDDLWEDTLAHIENKYNYDKIDNIFIMGDGASWIKTGLEWLHKSKYIADKFHIMKAIVSMVGGKREYVSQIRDAIYELNFEKVKELEYEIIAEEMDKNKRDKMKKTLQYILNNEEGIKNSILYDVPGCSAEGDISHTFSARLSSRPMGWSERNVDKMARLRILAANGKHIKLVTRNSNNFTEEKKKVVEEHDKVYNMISGKTFMRADGISYSIPEMKYGEYEIREELKEILSFKAM